MPPAHFSLIARLYLGIVEQNPGLHGVLTLLDIFMGKLSSSIKQWVQLALGNRKISDSSTAKYRQRFGF